MGKHVKLVATDLDGTILSDQKQISGKDLLMLRTLGERGIIRVAATGRSLFKVNEVLSNDVPFDYIVFSSGAGVYDWRRKELLASEHFEKALSDELCQYLMTLNINYVVFMPIPNNNLFLYRRGGNICPEFERYLERHKEDCSEYTPETFKTSAGQFLAIIPNDGHLFEQIRDKVTRVFKGIRVIRTTSPVDTRYTWLEIFPETVSKGHGIKWICDRHGIDYTATAGVGNDFNDIDMLDFVAYPYILGNSTQGIDHYYQRVERTNNASGFSFVIEKLLFGTE